MIQTQIVRDEADTADLLNTYSDEYYKLRQNETGKVYGYSVIDTIEGYADGEPYGNYTYSETEEKDETPEEGEEVTV